MKTLLKISLITLFSVFLMQPVHGQRLLNKLKQRVEQKIEEKAEKKVDEKIETETEERKGDINTNTNSGSNSGEDQMQKGLQGFLKGMGVSSTPVPIADSYKFDHLIQMHIESYDNTGTKTSEGEFITHLNPKSKSMAYQVVSGDMGNPGQGMFIIDAENGATIILSEEDGEKSGIVYGMGAYMETLGETYEEEELEETPDLYLANPNVKKTGKTKTIAGYKCEEYVFSDEEIKSNVWITKDLKMNTQDLFSTLFKASLYSHGMAWGYMMETTSENRQTGEKSIMRVTKVDTNSNVKFSMSNYKITNLGSFQIPTE